MGFLLKGAFMSEAKASHFRVDFDYDGQIKVCAQQLETLRRDFSDTWGSLLGGEGFRKEFKLIAKLLIRISSESHDHRATVDFVTKKAQLHLKNRSDENSGKIKKDHLDGSTDLAHEHMVPVQVALEYLVSLQGQALTEPLKNIGYRALIDKPDAHGVLDRGGSLLRQKLPAGVTVKSVPPMFWGLARYDAAKLFDELDPVNKRAKDLHDAYKLRRDEFRRVMKL